MYAALAKHNYCVTIAELGLLGGIAYTYDSRTNNKINNIALLFRKKLKENTAISEDYKVNKFTMPETKPVTDNKAASPQYAIQTSRHMLRRSCCIYFQRSWDSP